MRMLPPSLMSNDFHTCPFAIRFNCSSIAERIVGSTSSGSIYYGDQNINNTIHIKLLSMWVYMYRTIIAPSYLTPSCNPSSGPHQRLMCKRVHIYNVEVHDHFHICFRKEMVLVVMLKTCQILYVHRGVLYLLVQLFYSLICINPLWRYSWANYVQVFPPDS